MTRLSMSMSAVLLTMTLTPAAQAYGTDPASDALEDIAQIGLSLPAEPALEGTCRMPLTAETAQILALPDNWRDEAQTDAANMACRSTQ